MDKENSAAFALLDGQTTHPLMTPVILDRLFSYFDLNTIRTLRLVCRVWENLTRSLFFMQTKVEFSCRDDSSFSDIIDGSENWYFRPVNVGIKFTRLPEDIIWRCNEAEPIDVCRQWFFKYGRGIDSLTLHNLDHRLKPLTRTTLTNVLCFPYQLQKLDISFAEYHFRDSPYETVKEPLLPFLTELVFMNELKCSRDFIEGFFKTCPNLSRLSVIAIKSNFLDEFCSALQQPWMPRIEQLFIEEIDKFLDAHVEAIQQSNLQLKLFHAVQHHADTFNLTSTTSLLNSLSYSLENLFVESMTIPFVISNTLLVDQMPQLKHVSIENWTSQYDVWDFCFINMLPSLKTLKLVNRKSSGPDMYRTYHAPCSWNIDNLVQHSKLRVLTLPAVEGCYPEADVLQKLLGKFDNLIDLTLNTNDENLAAVIAGAPNLQALKIANLSKITDKGLTGLVYSNNKIHETSACIYASSGSNFQHFDRVCVEYFQEEEDIGQVLQSLNVNLGVTSLKDLSCLKLNGTDGNITDASLRHGIMHMENLQHFHFTGCHFTNAELSRLAQNND